MKKNQIKKGICALLTAAMAFTGSVGSIPALAAAQEDGSYTSGYAKANEDYALDYAKANEDCASGFVIADEAYASFGNSQRGCFDSEDIQDQDVLADIAMPEAADETGFADVSGEETDARLTVAGDYEIQPEDGFAEAEEEVQGEDEGSIAGNLNAQNYVRWASPIKSYIYADDDGFLVVRADDTHLVFRKYDVNHKLIEGSEQVIKNPLSACENPLFGGLYRDSEGDFYAFFGQQIANDDPNAENAEVIRVVRYDSDLKQKGEAVSLKNINTRWPFKSGSLRVAEKGDFLYVRTSRRMDADEKGDSHQANLTFEIKKSEMKVVDIQYKVSNLSTGYASHSFDQYILVDDSSNIVAVDHQDSDPRAIIMGKYGTMAGLGNFTTGSDYEYVEALKIAGPKNDNASGVALGGFEYSAANYLIAGSSVAQDKTWKEANENLGRNIFISVVPRNKFEDVNVVYLTEYKAGSDTFASAPQMVKYDNNRFLLIWNELKTGNANGKMCYVWVDGNGKKVGDIHTRTGYVTDCHPIIANGSVVWFYDDGNSVEFLSVTPEDSEKDKKDEGPGNSGNGEDSGTVPEEVNEENESGSVSADYIGGCYYMVKGSKAFIPGTKKIKGDKTYKVEYSISKPTYVKLNSKGVISAKRPYDKPITVKVTRNGKVTEFKVRVVEPEVLKKLYVNKGESVQIPVKNANVLSARDFVPSDEAAVSISANGVVTGKEAKKVKVTYNIGTKKYTITVIVCDQVIKGKDSVAEGKSLKLKLKGGAPGEIKWKSSSPAVATVDEKGKVTAIKAGKAVISATNNGRTVTKEISVTK